MTKRTEHDQRLRELKAALMARVAKIALSNRTTGFDGLMKSFLSRGAGPVEHDPELDHPEADARPID